MAKSQVQFRLSGRRDLEHNLLRLDSWCRDPNPDPFQDLLAECASVTFDRQSLKGDLHFRQQGLKEDILSW
jgi:hypothetical protein